MLVGAAVAIAVIGIAFAVLRLKPAALKSKSASAPETGVEKVLLNKYYVDEAYDAVVIDPTVTLSRTVLWKGVDAGLIDGFFVNGLASLARGFGWIGSRFQTGSVGTYAWALVAGVLIIIGAFTLR
jgi:NADH-quinone oxidoreductase subunit L